MGRLCCTDNKLSVVVTSDGGNYVPSSSRIVFDRFSLWRLFGWQIALFELVV